MIEEYVTKQIPHFEAFVKEYDDPFSGKHYFVARCDDGLERLIQVKVSQITSRPAGEN